MRFLLAIALAQWAAVGDSTTNCCSTPGWPYYLGRACGRPVANRAVAGATTSEIRDQQWPAALDGGVSVIFIQGGFNDLHNYAADAGSVFSRLGGIAEDAFDSGIAVVFVTVSPGGGYMDPSEEQGRRDLAALEASWAVAHHQGFVDLDESLINCGNRFGAGIQALCDFARISDPVHPSEGAQAVIGAFIAERVHCSPRAPDGGAP